LSSHLGPRHRSAEMNVLDAVDRCCLSNCRAHPALTALRASLGHFVDSPETPMRLIAAPSALALALTLGLAACQPADEAAPAGDAADASAAAEPAAEPDRDANVDPI